MEKTCRIVGAGDFFSQNFHVFPNDLVIAADGGFRQLEKIQVKPNYLVGDFDSFGKPEYAAYEGINVIRLNKEKDETDMLCAIRLGQSLGYSLFHIHGGCGGRPDHTFANIQCVAGLSKQSAVGILFFKDYVITAVTNGEVSVFGSAGEYVSVFAYGGTARGVNLKGLKYELKDASLDCMYPIGVSNELISHGAEISVEKGTLLLSCPVNTVIIHTS